MAHGRPNRMDRRFGAPDCAKDQSATAHLGRKGKDQAVGSPGPTNEVEPPEPPVSCVLTAG